MRGFGDLIVRSIAILFGLLLAFPAAALFLVGGVHGGWFVDVFSGYEPTAPVAEDLAFVTILIVAGMVAWKMAVTAGLPALAAIAIAEWARLRGLVTNLLLGAAVSAAGAWIWTQGAGPFLQGDILAVAAAGFLGGLVYWAVAGRNAGRWLDRADW